MKSILSAFHKLGAHRIQNAGDSPGGPQDPQEILVPDLDPPIITTYKRNKERRKEDREFEAALQMLNQAALRMYVSLIFSLR